MAQGLSFSLIQLGLVLAAGAGLNGQPATPALTIEQAVEEALRNNVPLLAERVNISIADARIMTARLRPNPTLSAGGDHLDILGTGFSEDNAAGPTEINLRTDFLVESAGKRRRRTEVAEQGRSVAELSFMAVARVTVLEVQNLFLDAMLARETLALARENLGSLDRIVEINEVRLRAGDIARVEMVRSRLAALQFRNSVRQAELRLRTALIRLATTLGRQDPDSVREVAGAFRRDADIPASSELLRLAMQLRPDLRALRAEIARAGAEYRLQRAQAKPDYTLGTEYRRQQGLAGKGNSLGVFIEVALPVFNRNQGEIERAVAEQRQAELRLRAQERIAAAEIENACRQGVASREILALVEGTMLEQARTVREATDYSYRRGEATLLELLDAQRAFNDTMQSYNEALAEYARSLYLIDSVSGKAVTP